jgi:uncharacterized membrane protein YfcA
LILLWSARHRDSTQVGALLGAFLNKIMPDIVLTVLLVILLTATADSTLKKGVKMYKKESAAIAKVCGRRSRDAARRGAAARRDRRPSRTNTQLGSFLFF